MADSIRTFVLESGEVLPLLMMFCFSFFGIMTSNIGMILIVCISLLIVPAISFMGSATGSAFSNGNIFYKALFFLTPFIVFLPIFGYTYNDLKDEDNKGKRGGIATAASFVPALLTAIIAMFAPNVSQLQVLNPFRWFSTTISPQTVSTHCSLLPGATSGTTPSTWMILFSFLYGIFVHNAVSLYTFPAPTFSTKPSPELQASVDQKVDARKRIAITSIVITTVFLLLGLWYRTRVLSCDSWIDLPTYAFIALVGSSIYSFLVNQCGVRPVDLFGLVSNYLPPEASSRPVVCSVPSTS
jgi:hypothetical protein